MYSPQILDHFQNPRNAGEVQNADARVQMENPACGDVLELSAKTRDGQFTEVRFRAKGCVSAMACASALTEMISGISITKARSLDRGDLMQKIGELPPASEHAAYLAIDTLRALLKKL